MNHQQLSLGGQISVLYRYQQNYISKKLEPHNIGSGQYVFLLVLYRKNGISQEELSAYLKIDKATTAKAIKKLMDDGYICRYINSNDKRAYQVFLTEKALAIQPIVQEAIQSWQKLIISGLTEEETLLVEQLLQKMAQNALHIKEHQEESQK
jgi:DNA-binding MarR family transcriptional regulator